MLIREPSLLVAVCGVAAMTFLAGCTSAPSRSATGEEIAAAVEYAERELAEANANRRFEPNSQPLATALPY